MDRVKDSKNQILDRQKIKFKNQELKVIQFQINWALEIPKIK